MMKTRWHQPRRLGAFFLLLCSACLATQRPIGGFDSPPPEGSTVQLLVTNNYGFPIEVFAVGGGAQYRMGTVLPGLPGRFVLRQAMVGNGTVEFVARPGDRNPAIRSGPLLLSPGNIVELDIALGRTTSSARVRR